MRIVEAWREALINSAALRIGIVGAGPMEPNHARVLASLSSIELVGVADPDPTQRVFMLGCPALPVDGLLGVQAVTIAARSRRAWRC